MEKTINSTPQEIIQTRQRQESQSAEALKIKGRCKRFPPGEALKWNNLSGGKGTSFTEIHIIKDLLFTVIIFIFLCFLDNSRGREVILEEKGITNNLGSERRS